MEISRAFKNHNGRCVFILRFKQNKVTYLAITPEGVTVEVQAVNAFSKEYNIPLPYSFDKAAIMFLQAIKRGYLYSKQSYQLLKEIIMENNNAVNSPLRDALEAAASPTEAQNEAATKKAEKAAKVKADKPPKEAKPRGQGIGAFCVQMIQDGADNAAILKAVQEKWPDAKTSPASIAWYRNNLKTKAKAEA